MRLLFINKQTLIFFLSITLISYAKAQDNHDNEDHRITLDVVDMALEDLLELLQKEMDVPVAYAIDNIPGGILITVHVHEVLLSEFFELICRQARLHCEFVDGYFILRYGDDADPVVILRERNVHDKRSSLLPIEQKNSPPSMNTSLTSHPSNTSSTDTGNYSINPTPVVYDASVDHPHEDMPGGGPPSLKGLENKGGIIWNDRPLTIVSMPSVPDQMVRENKRTKQVRPVISAIFSPDVHEFHFKSGIMSDQYYRSMRNYSVGVNVYVALPLKKTWLSAGVQVSTKDFKYLYNYRVLDLADPIPIPDITTIELTYLEIPIEALYSLIKYQKFVAGLTVGYHASILIDKHETTSYQNTEDQQTDIYLPFSRSYLGGASLGIALTYPAGEKWTFGLTPQFIHYFHPVNSQAMKSPTELFRIKVRIAFSI